MEHHTLVFVRGTGSCSRAAARAACHCSHCWQTLSDTKFGFLLEQLLEQLLRDTQNVCTQWKDLFISVVGCTARSLRWCYWQCIAQQDTWQTNVVGSLDKEMANATDETAERSDTKKIDITAQQAL